MSEVSSYSEILSATDAKPYSDRNAGTEVNAASRTAEAN